MSKKNVCEAVRELAEPFCQELGLILWDVKFLKEGPDWKLRLIIDKETSVDIEDCVNLSHAIDEPLDELDPIEQSYSLQVQSPGIERELVYDWHLEKYINEKIMLKSRVGVDGMKEFKGTLQAFDENTVTVVCADTVRSFERKLLVWIKADDFNE